jgi:hypothetical protein
MSMWMFFRGVAEQLKEVPERAIHDRLPSSGRRLESRDGLQKGIPLFLRYICHGYC